MFSFMFKRILMAALLATAGWPALAQTYTVERVEAVDFKSIYGEVRSRKVAPARTRIPGTLSALHVREGDQVDAGQVIAVVGDPKIALRIDALDARIAAARAEVDNARTERDRVAELFERKVVAKAALDRVETTFDVAMRRLETTQAERMVLVEQIGEGDVLAPSSGRVLHVPMTIGGVVGAGETVAEIAEEDFILRLSMPERHARAIAVGDRVLVRRGDEGAPLAEGRVMLVYPDVAAGRVTADAEVAGLSDYFVGQRVQAWLAVGARETLVIPRDAVETISGVDFVTVRDGDADIRVVVRLGPPLRDDPDRVEVLSGLRAGDILSKR